ncbi:hypothetical protein V8D89_004945 [Ganoderma adspersum]
MDPSDSAAEIVAEYSNLFVTNCCFTASSVVFMYEYFITVGEEAKYFWKHKVTGASAIFFLNRYIPLTFYALDFTGFASMSDQSDHYSVAFSGSRAFALTNRNWLILFLIGGLSFMPVIINLIPAHYGLTGEIVPVIGCVVSDSTPEDVGRRLATQTFLTIISRASIIAADSLLILVTWISLFRKHTKLSLTFGAATLAEVLLRDGTIYFVSVILPLVPPSPLPLIPRKRSVLMVLNVLHLTFSLVSVAIPALQNASYMTAFTDPITSILVQRFMLHLQAANHRALDLDLSQKASSVQRSSSLVFDRVIGSLGASIPPEDFFGSSEDDMDRLEDELEGEMGRES